MELMTLKAETESKLYREQCATQKVRGVVQAIQSRQEQLSKKNVELKAKTDNHEQEFLREKNRCIGIVVSCDSYLLQNEICMNTNKIYFL